MSTKTTWTDLSRRAATVLLVVLSLLAVPAVASAKFTSARSAAQSVGTDRMETVTGLSGSYYCSRNSSVESILLTVSDFSDAGPSGATYAYSLVRAGSLVDSASTTATSASLSGWKANDNLSTTWTVRVQSSLYRWTGGVASVNITCPSTSSKWGTF